MTSTSRGQLTVGLLAVVAEVAFHRLDGYARLLPHGVDLRHAELGVELEEKPSVQNGQVMLVPVPQVLQVLVVDGQERVRTDERKERKKILAPPGGTCALEHEEFYQLVAALSE